MKKILFGITSLTLGGAERVLVDLANKLTEDYDITIFTIYDGGELKKQLDKKVHTISLYDKPFNKFSKIEKIKISLNLLFKEKAPTGYDIKIAFLEGPITRLFSKKNGKKLILGKREKIENSKSIAWVHNDISKVFGNGIKSKLKKVLDKNIYKKYDEIIFVSEENKRDFDKDYKLNVKENIIRNYLDYKIIIEKAEEKTNLPYNDKDINLLTVCRLVDQKALDRFIKVHSKLENEGIHSKVYIVGDGPERYELQKQIDKLGETENFYLLGAKENPYPYIKNSDLFCLLSYFEGYGMVIDEAKILNKPIIITDTAAKEGIKNYNKAIILDNTEKGVYEGLKKVLTSDKITMHINQEKNQEEIEKTNKEYYSKILEQVKKVIK